MGSVAHQTSQFNSAWFGSFPFIFKVTEIGFYFFISFFLSFCCFFFPPLAVAIFVLSYVAVLGGGCKLGVFRF